MSEDFLQLREQIADLDRSLLELLERRFELAAAVGRLKAEREQPVVVHEVEQRVLSRAREAAELCGASPEVMEAIFAAVIRGSVERQHRVGVQMKAKGGARILVIGAAGGMGGWLRRFLASIGHRTEEVDTAWAGLSPAAGRFPKLAAVPDLGAYDAIFVAVPLQTTGEVLDQLAADPPGVPVFELTSIKTPLREPLLRLRRAGTDAIAIHPMFGPDKNLYEPLTIAHAVLEDEAAERQKITELLAHPYLNLVSVMFAHHDRLMGWLLGLSHLTGMLFADALTRSGLDPAELASVASVSFDRQVATARSVLAADNHALYYAIQRLNPFRGEVYAALTAALEEISGAVERNDGEAFAAALSRAAAQLPDLGNSS